MACVPRHGATGISIEVSSLRKCFGELTVLNQVDLARSIRRYRDLIWNTLDHALSNARSEATNTHLRALDPSAPTAFRTQTH